MRLAAAALCALLATTSCVTYRQLIPSANARAVLVRHSGGIAPVTLALLEIHDGCIVYRRGWVKRRVCTPAIRESIRSGQLSREGITHGLDLLRYLPVTSYDTDHLYLQQRDAAMTATLDALQARPMFLAWLRELEALVGAAVGDDYESLIAP